MPNTADRAREICKPEAEKLDLILWDVRYIKEGAAYYLRVIIDKPGGVFIEDCESLSRAVDPLLDEADFIREHYILEVSSPGVGRELSRPEHFPPYMGREVTVKLIRPRLGVKQFTGSLTAYENGAVTLEVSGEPRIFPQNEISKINLFEEIQ